MANKGNVEKKNRLLFLFDKPNKLFGQYKY